MNISMLSLIVHLPQLAYWIRGSSWELVTFSLTFPYREASPPPPKRHSWMRHNFQYSFIAYFLWLPNMDIFKWGSEITSRRMWTQGEAPGTIIIHVSSLAPCQPSPPILRIPEPAVAECPLSFPELHHWRGEISRQPRSPLPSHMLESKMLTEEIIIRQWVPASGNLLLHTKWLWKSFKAWTLGLHTVHTTTLPAHLRDGETGSRPAHALPENSSWDWQGQRLRACGISTHRASLADQGPRDGRKLPHKSGSTASDTESPFLWFAPWLRTRFSLKTPPSLTRYRKAQSPTLTQHLRDDSSSQTISFPQFSTSTFKVNLGYHQM